MSYMDLQIAELQSLMADLGKAGGLISPSIYDTAQVLRLYPPPEGPESTLDWLLQQQQADGGWGDPSVSYARDVPTLATILALHAHRSTRPAQAAIDAGMAFLREQADQWAALPIDELPVATEMILPRLIQEANTASLFVDPTPYATLFMLRERKCQQIQKMNPPAGSAPTYSWEAWGQAASQPLFDFSRGIGHSPSATAAWLGQTQQVTKFANFRQQGQAYLQKAAASTHVVGTDVPGIFPNVWPITGFERAYGPYILLAAGFFHHPALQQAVATQVAELESIIIKGNGVSFGDYFVPDVDDTALTVATLHAMKKPYHPHTLMQFRNGSHFYTFAYELNPSVFSNAHALHALVQIGQRDPETEQFLLDQQRADGRWLADKWHSSWIYTTLEVVLALSQVGYPHALTLAASALLAHQNADGGWGANRSSTQIETSYAVLALCTLARVRLLNDVGSRALVRGHAWLARHYQPNCLLDEPQWLGKELYTPYRVNRIYVLCANLAATVWQEALCR